MWSTIIEGEGPEQSLSHRFAVSGEPGKRGGGLEERGVEEEKRGGGRPVYSVSTGKLPPLKTAKKSETE